MDELIQIIYRMDAEKALAQITQILVKLLADLDMESPII
jgi:hypothetical protein